MGTEEGIRLEFSDDRLPLTAVSEINTALAEVGTGVWPLDLVGAPDDVRRLLTQPTLTDAEAERVRTHFLLPRERLLEIIEAAGRKPNVPGGGELTTFVSNHGYSYPQLWVVQGDVDYTRFDRFHVNISEDGIGVDEVLQVISGRGVVIRLRLLSGRTGHCAMRMTSNDAQMEVFSRFSRTTMDLAFTGYRRLGMGTPFPDTESAISSGLGKLVSTTRCHSSLTPS